MDLKSYYEEYNMYEDVFMHNLFSFLRLEKIERKTFSYCYHHNYTKIICSKHTKSMQTY